MLNVRCFRKQDRHSHRMDLPWSVGLRRSSVGKNLPETAHPGRVWQVAWSQEWERPDKVPRKYAKRDRVERAPTRRSGALVVREESEGYTYDKGVKGERNEDASVLDSARSLAKIAAVGNEGLSPGGRSCREMMWSNVRTGGTAWLCLEMHAGALGRIIG
jgi:hypothetical protein